MKKDTYKLKIDPEDGRNFFEQDIDEADKNHGFYDTNKANQGRAYKIPGK